MSDIKENIRSILNLFLTDLDNTNISESQQRALLDTLKEISSPYVSAYTAMRMAGKKRSEFYELIRQGKLPKGEHIIGFKEIHYNKAELERAIEILASENK